MQSDKEVTIYDIAKHLNISATTVSRGLKDHPAINKNTKKKLLRLPKTWDTDRIHSPAVYAAKKLLRSALLSQA